MDAEQNFIESNGGELISSDSGTQVPKEESSSHEKKEKPSKIESSEWLQFSTKFHAQIDSEEKIRLAISFMKECLSHALVPRFRDFWEARKLCLLIFKENLSSKARNELWQEYLSLSSEARRLKEIHDEQSVFAFEQIDLAVQALVSEVENCEERLQKLPDIEFPLESPTIQAKKQKYNQIQKELQLLNVFAARTNALRKEVIKTDMRVRNKNKLFEKLSLCGDKIFPKRKDLIRAISEQFLGDVEGFVQAHCAKEEIPAASLYQVREEIKALQSIAKLLTLNTHAFNETRLKLSECWDKVKKVEKERKKEISHKRLQQKQSFEEALEKVKEFEQFCKEQASLAALEKPFEDLLQYLKTLDLAKIDAKIIKDRIYQCKKPLEDEAEKIRNEAKAKVRALEAERIHRINELKTSLQNLVQQVDALTMQELVERKEECETTYQTLTLSKSEKMQFDRLFKQLKDTIHDKKRKNVLHLTQADSDQLQELKNLLEESKSRRAEIKQQLEVYRKALGGSGFDFEKGMLYREQMEADKLSLEKINEAIESLEEKIDEIEG